MLILPEMYPGACLDWKVCVPRMLPRAKETMVRALMVTFLVCPAMLLGGVLVNLGNVMGNWGGERGGERRETNDAFQASSNMNAAPKS